MYSKEIFYWETNSTDPSFNLAFEEYLLIHKKQGDHLILWQNDKTVVIGNNQILEAEINRPYIDTHHIRVVRRSTGGGAVYHDLGNLNYSFITDYDPDLCLNMAPFMEPMVKALRDMGLPAEVSGRNDILLEGRKISGTAQRIVGNRILHHGTLLFDSDPDAVAGALQVNPEKFQGKGTRSVQSRIGTIRPLLDEDMDIRGFQQRLKAAFLPPDTVSCPLSPEEFQQVLQIKAEKYDTPEWNQGRSPAAELHDGKRFSGGVVEVYAQLQDGHISAISFRGDFMSRKPISHVEAVLTGLPFTPEAVGRALNTLSLPDYFGSVTEEELLSLLF